jgi:predicted transglutaminase-like cysteine proteinase
MVRKVVLAFALFSLAAPSVNQPAFGASTLPPLGYQLMCLKHPEECRGGGTSKVDADTALLETLKRVNAKVNRTIRPARDRSGVDVWSVDASVGDCEDFALRKRQELVDAGIPASSLRIAYVKTRRGEDHAVLIVKTNRADLVLDNLTSAIRPLSQSGLRLISMSGANPLVWS